MEPNAQAAPTPTPAAAPPPAAKPAEATLPNVPATWPGAFGLYKYSKAAVKINLGTIIGLYLLGAVLNAILRATLKVPGDIIYLLIGGLLTSATTLTLLSSARHQVISFGNALSKGVKFWLRMVVLSILVGIVLIISFLLLIIPFFFVLPRVSLAFYYLVDKDMGFMDAFKASWDNTKGHSGMIWGVIGASFAMALLMVTIIGIPFAIYFLVMYNAAWALLYEFINKQPAAQPVAAAVPAPTPPAPAQ